MLTISTQTQKFIENFADYDVEKAYGRGDEYGARGARMVALAGLKMDLAGQVEPEHLDAVAHTELASRARAALDARRCQCHQLGEGGVCWHGDYPAPRGFATRPVARCENYHEHDVPEIDGAKLCGSCYTADERGLPLAD